MKEEDAIKCDEYVKHTLDMLVCEKRFVLGGFACENLSVERIRDYATNSLLYSLHTLIPAENLKHDKHTVTVEYPATWWESLKEQYLPAWLKTKCPIKYKTKSETVKFTAYNLYPEFPALHPERCGNAIRTITKYIDYGAEEK